MTVARVEVKNKVYRVEIKPPGEPVKQISVDQPQQVKVVMVGTQGPPGPGSSADFVIGETPTGAIDGSNATFQTAYDFVPESVEVYLNGLALKRIDEFNTSGTRQIILLISPNAGETILVDYLKP